MDRGCRRIALVVTALCAVVANCGPKTPEEIARDKREWALAWCQTAIKESLRDPSSAEFLNILDTRMEKSEQSGNYTGALMVRAANGFGGKTVSVMVCTVHPNSDERTWRLVDLKEMH